MTKMLRSFRLWSAMALIFLAAEVQGFTKNTVPQTRHSPSSLTVLQVAPTLRIPLLGRFRKKRPVEQTVQIQVGGSLPDIDVEQLMIRGDEDGTEPKSEPVSIKEVLQTSSAAVLIGMPGAFTPTCTQKHLPGYIQAMPKLASLGVDKIAVVTTNDRFVNQEWREQAGLLGGSNNKESSIMILCDGDGDLVKNLGLAEDMGFGVGVRSQRFVLVTDGNGVVTHMLKDEGMDECSATSADNLIKLLSPDGETDDAGLEVDGKVLGTGVAGVALLFVLSSLFGGGGGSGSTTPAPTRQQPQVQRTQPAKQIKSQEKSQFSLLNEYR